MQTHCICCRFTCRPIRKYFDYLQRSTERDVETGECGDELSSIRVVRSYPSERPSSTASFNNVRSASQGYPAAAPTYQSPGTIIVS